MLWFFFGCMLAVAVVWFIQRIRHGAKDFVGDSDFEFFDLMD